MRFCLVLIGLAVVSLLIVALEFAPMFFKTSILVVGYAQRSKFISNVFNESNFLYKHTAGQCVGV
jgi:hypothetical protein